MEAAKRLGIWMDYATAHLMEFTANPIQTKTIRGKFTPQVKKTTLGKSEHVMHNKEKHGRAEYYRKLAGVIKKYDNVILFGPTKAKAELLNLLNADHCFSEIKIDVKQAGKMNTEQQHNFVKEYFSKRYPL